MSALRENFNKKVEYYGNIFGIGDILTTPVSKKGLIGLCLGLGVGATASGCAGLDTAHMKGEIVNPIAIDIAQTELDLRAHREGVSARDNAKRIGARAAELVDSVVGISTYKPFSGEIGWQKIYPGVYNHDNSNKASFSLDDLAEQNVGGSIQKKVAWHFPHTAGRILKSSGRLVKTVANSTVIPFWNGIVDLVKPETSRDAEVFAVEKSPNPKYDTAKRVIDNVTAPKDWIQYGLYCLFENSGMIGDSLWAGDDKLARWAGLRGNGKFESGWREKARRIDGTADSWRIALNVLPSEIDAIVYGNKIRADRQGFRYIPITTPYSLRLNPSFNYKGTLLYLGESPGIFWRDNMGSYLNPTVSNSVLAGQLSTTALSLFCDIHGSSSSAAPASGSGRTGGGY